MASSLLARAAGSLTLQQFGRLCRDPGEQFGQISALPLASDELVLECCIETFTVATVRRKPVFKLAQ